MNPRDIDVEVFVLCQAIEFKPGSRRVDGVRGFFSMVNPSGLPWKCDLPIYAFALVSNLIGQVPTIIRIVHADSVETLWEEGKILATMDTRESTQILIELKGLVLRTPGEHWVQLIAKSMETGEETVLEQRRLHLLTPSSEQD